MANEQNLRPPFSPEEAREYGKKGAKRSAEVRAQKKTIAAVTKKMLQQKVTDPKLLELMRKMGITTSKTPMYLECMVAGYIVRALKKGTLDDLLKLQQIIGEKPNVEASPALDTLEAILKGLKDSAENEGE